MSKVKTKPQSKSDRVKQLLARAKGASIEEISEATQWQAHSVRSFLTGLRKRGFILVREQRGDEGSAYRITSGPSAKEASR
ncbi:DUF3489 domain-containing protein [Sphingorhabdus sp. Alg231-15]|uniref:DUF3489 domain-containing protein n=1 Tax=Sphingorhabdus sp. Alg231-15 TaxID=1922222 RepID=UPI000D55F640